MSPWHSIVTKRSRSGHHDKKCVGPTKVGPISRGIQQAIGDKAISSLVPDESLFIIEERPEASDAIWHACCCLSILGPCSCLSRGLDYEVLVPEGCSLGQFMSNQHRRLFARVRLRAQIPSDAN